MKEWKPFRIDDVCTPALIYDERVIRNNLVGLEGVLKEHSCRVFFSLKALSMTYVLTKIASSIGGFAVSSLNEAKLAREILGRHKIVHITTPGLRPEEIDEICDQCDYVSFNSLQQWQRYYPIIRDKINCGLRINPQLSFVRDDKYNPCRINSKLGVPIEVLKNIINTDRALANNIKGIHFHSNCESNNFEQLLITVKHIATHLPEVLRQIDWINLGGGYLFDNPENYDKLYEAIFLLRKSFGINDVFVEPGNGIIGNAGYIISSVLDVFESQGKNIAILDTTVNHMPEVFEYQYRPDIMQECKDGNFEYILAGCSCLAGDVFGQYNFSAPLKTGDRIVFTDMGAYTLVKAHMFNGINLPTIYAYSKEGRLELVKEFNYADFLSANGGNEHVPLRKRTDSPFRGKKYDVIEIRQ